MLDQSLTTTGIIEHARRHHASAEVVSFGAGTLHRCGYADVDRRARRLASALTRFGIRTGERVGTLAWNSYRHLELFFGVPGMGAVCHTVNPRLFDEHVSYIINHGGDRIVFFDEGFLPLVKRIALHCPQVGAWVPMTGDASTAADPDLSYMSYESFLASGDEDYAWPVVEENSAAMLCYTSGTTGLPKGVVYTHRATVLHAYAAALPDSMNLSAREVILPVVPMFHAKAWELPFAVPLVGAKLVLPGAKLDGASVYAVMLAERVTLAVGVPTVWQSLLAHVNGAGLHLGTLRRLLVGGSATPPALIEGYAALGVELFQGWGMTETAALTTCAQPLAMHQAMPAAEVRERVNLTQGRIVPGADMRIVAEDGTELPWDGVVAGQLQIRAPWVPDRYFRAENSALVDGWLPTGDMARIDPEGFMHITDRLKDVIKSGGEWISSVDIENIVSSHGAVQFAACIACLHPKWGERPLLVVQRRPGHVASREDLLGFFDGKVAKWWIPDDVVFVESMPMTATGKLQKMALREQFKNHVLGTEKERAQ